MINEYDRPVKGYKTSEQFEHPDTVLYDNFAPKTEEEIFVQTAEEVPETEGTVIEEVIEPAVEEIIEESEGEE